LMDAKCSESSAQVSEPEVALATKAVPLVHRPNVGAVGGGVTIGLGPTADTLGLTQKKPTVTLSNRTPADATAVGVSPNVTVSAVADGTTGKTRITRVHPPVAFQLACTTRDATVAGCPPVMAPYMTAFAEMVGVVVGAVTEVVAGTAVDVPKAVGTVDATGVVAAVPEVKFSKTQPAMTTNFAPLGMVTVCDANRLTLTSGRKTVEPDSASNCVAMGCEGVPSHPVEPASAPPFVIMSVPLVAFVHNEAWPQTAFIPPLQHSGPAACKSQPLVALVGTPGMVSLHALELPA